MRNLEALLYHAGINMRPPFRIITGFGLKLQLRLSHAALWACAGD